MALYAVVVVTGQGLGLPGMDQMHHVHGEVALGLAAGRLSSILELALQLAHPPAVLQPGVFMDILDSNELSPLLHKIVSVEELLRRNLCSGAGLWPVPKPSVHFQCKPLKDHLLR